MKYCAFFAAIIIESRTAVFTPPVPRVGSNSSSSISGESLRWGNRCLSHIQVPPRQQPKNPRKERTNIRWEEVQLSREIKGGVVVYEPLEEINAPVLSCLERINFVIGYCVVKIRLNLLVKNFSEQLVISDNYLI